MGGKEETYLSRTSPNLSLVLSRLFHPPNPPTHHTQQNPSRWARPPRPSPPRPWPSWSPTSSTSASRAVAPPPSLPGWTTTTSLCYARKVGRLGSIMPRPSFSHPPTHPTTSPLQIPWAPTPSKTTLSPWAPRPSHCWGPVRYVCRFPSLSPHSTNPPIPSTYIIGPVPPQFGGRGLGPASLPVPQGRPGAGLCEWLWPRHVPGDQARGGPDPVARAHGLSFWGGGGKEEREGGG